MAIDVVAGMSIHLRHTISVHLPVRHLSLCLQPEMLFHRKLLKLPLHVVPLWQGPAQPHERQSPPEVGIEIVVEIDAPQIQDRKHTQGNVAEQPASPRDGFPHLPRQDLGGAVRPPRSDQPELGVEAAAATPDVRETPAGLGVECELDNLPERRCLVHVLCELVRVGIMLDAIGDAAGRGVNDAVVPLIVGIEPGRYLAQEVLGKEHRLQLSQGRYRAESGADEADEANGGIVGLPDLSDIALPAIRIRPPSFIFLGMQEREARDVPCRKYCDVRLDLDLLDALGFWPAVVGEVRHAVGGHMAREGGHVDGAADGGNARVEEEAADASSQGPLRRSVGLGYVRGDALPGFVPEDFGC